MRFLCVVCDQQMKLQRTVGPDRGSVTLIYACPSCGYPVAMMTNPHETQVVTSLGISVGAPGEPAAASKCPFTGMLKDLEQPADGGDRVRWSAEAQERLAGIPEAVRPMAASGIERYARDHGHREVDLEVLEQARQHFGV